MFLNRFNRFTYWFLLGLSFIVLSGLIYMGQAIAQHGLASLWHWNWQSNLHALTQGWPTSFSSHGRPAKALNAAASNTIAPQRHALIFNLPTKTVG